MPGRGNDWFTPRTPHTTLRSQATRDRILLEASRLFARHKYEATTIRAVATAAGVTPALVMRYYGSKDGLFAAVTELNFYVPDLSGIPPKDRGAAMVANFLQRWEGDSRSEGLHILIRVASSLESARLRLIEAVDMQTRAMVGNTGTPDSRRTRSALIATQFGGLAFTRYVLRIPSVVALDHPTIIRNIGPVIQHYLDS